MNKGFIFGRSTVQIMSAIGATLQFIGLVIGLFAPALAVTAIVLLNGVGGLLAVWVGVLANSSTTPTYDPILKAGQGVTLTNAAGDVLTSVTLPTVKDVTGDIDPDADPEESEVVD